MFNDVKFSGKILLDNIHAQNRVLSYNDLITQDFRYLLEYDVTSETQYSTIGNSSRVVILKLDESRALVSCYASGHKMFIIDNNGAIISSITTITSIGATSTPSLVLISTDKVAMAYSYGTTDGRCLIINTSGNTLTLYSSTTFNATQTQAIKVDVIDQTRLIVGYRDVVNSVGKLQFLTISGNNIIENPTSVTTFSGANDVSEIGMKILSETKGIIIFSDSTNNKGKNLIFDIDLTLNVITINPELIFQDSFLPVFLFVQLINETRAILSYSRSTGVFYVGFLDISNTNITNYAPKILTYESEAVTSKSITSITETIISISYVTVTGGITEYVKNVVLTIDNYKKDLLIEEVVTIKTSPAAGTLYVDSCLLNGRVCIIYGDGSDLILSSTFAYNFAYTTTKIDYEQVWDNNYTVFLANFENNLYAGNITGSVDGWRLKRKADDVDLYETIRDFLLTERTYIDYLPRNLRDYSYLIFALDSSGNESLGIEGIDALNFYGWILTDNVNTYKFDMGWDGVSSGDVSTNKDFYVYENYTKYPVVSFGVRNYRQGSIQTIPYTYNNITFRPTIDEDLRKEVFGFLNDGNEKWLKNTAGDILKVITSNAKYKYSDKVYTQPYEITFEWVEVDVGETGVDS